MAFRLTGGQCAVSPQFAPVLDQISVPWSSAGRPHTRPIRVLADKSYPSRANRAYLRHRGIQASTAPRRATAEDDPRHSTASNTIERAIGRLKRYSAISTRYDKLAVRYEATIQVAIILDWKPSS